MCLCVCNLICKVWYSCPCHTFHTQTRFMRQKFGQISCLHPCRARERKAKDEKYHSSDLRHNGINDKAIYEMIDIFFCHMMYILISHNPDIHNKSADDTVFHSIAENDPPLSAYLHLSKFLCSLWCKSSRRVSPPLWSVQNQLWKEITQICVNNTAGQLATQEMYKALCLHKWLFYSHPAVFYYFL